MGTSWTVWPLDEQMTTWLDQQEVAYPNVPSRFPTGKEIKQVLDGMPEYEIGINDNGIGRTWQVRIVSKTGGGVGEWTFLTVIEYTGDDKEQKLYFERGWESLITKIVRNLVMHCGPLVLIEHGDGTPNVITP